VPGFPVPDRDGLFPVLLRQWYQPFVPAV